MSFHVYIGWDPRETVAWQVAQASLLRNCGGHVLVHKLALQELRDRGLYRRPTTVREDGRLIDEVSRTADYDGSMSTEHACARFFLPYLLRHFVDASWVMFMDGDVLLRGDVCEAFMHCQDQSKALWCVQHQHKPARNTKMDGCVQTSYRRKNWSSVMILNMAHPAHRRLTLENLNTLPGRDLHAFYWLFDEEIGRLPHRWNYLVGYNKPIGGDSPKLVHFTEGLPNMPGYEACEYADEWWAEARKLPSQIAAE